MFDKNNLMIIYMKADAIRDGLLINVTDIESSFGLTVHVAIHSAT